MPDLAVYIHWPFCLSKCPYCDFNSHVAAAINHEKWNESYLTELDYFADYLQNKRITSIFFGGGTPSLMPPFIVENIINKLAKLAKISGDIEITLEGNPTSVESDNFKNFKNAGVNRVSLGVQALNQKDLAFLGREHSVDEALQAVDKAANIFDNYSFDLIYARPGQGLKSWEDELQKALKYTANHMSLYQLTIEKGTPFYAQYKSGNFQIPSDENAADLYNLTNEIMADFGLPAYEISNYARAGFESKHNLTYWKYRDYLGVGPGSHSRISLNGKKNAIMMTNNPEKWLNLVGQKQNGIQIQNILTSGELLEEVLMMGLRIKDGVSLVDFRTNTGQNLLDSLNKNKFELFIKEGFLVLENESLKATNKGVLLLNSIIGGLLS